MANPKLTQNPQLAIERAFVAMFLERPELSAGIDIVAASDRSVVVGPLHAFVLCVDFLPIIPAGPQGTATVAVGVVTDMDEHGEDVRKDWVSRFAAALSIQPQVYNGTDAFLQGWSIKSTKDESLGTKVMDVFALKVGATV